MHAFIFHEALSLLCFIGVFSCLQDALVADAGVDMLVRLMMAGGGVEGSFRPLSVC